MGNITIFVNKLVTWVGNLINKVICWFDGEIREKVEKNNKEFLNKNENKIINSKNPKQLAKVSVEIKSLKQLEKIAEEEKKKLCQEDLKMMDELFKDDPDFF